MPIFISVEGIDKAREGFPPGNPAGFEIDAGAGRIIVATDTFNAHFDGNAPNRAVEGFEVSDFIEVVSPDASPGDGDKDFCNVFVRCYFVDILIVVGACRADLKRYLAIIAGGIRASDGRPRRARSVGKFEYR
ncbi:hypothetical protein ES703_103394 [subsurface metagenome]